MKLTSLVTVLGIVLVPTVTAAQSFKETYECTFGNGLVNRPTPTKVVFSVDEFGRSAVLHDVEMPNVDTPPVAARVKRDTPRVLSITWSGQNYVFSDSGRSYASNEARYDAVDLIDVDFSVLLNRRNMSAMTKSKTSVAYASRDGFADGSCTKISNPNS